LSKMRVLNFYSPCCGGYRGWIINTPRHCREGWHDYLNFVTLLFILWLLL
jgi:hypothetical protein